MVQDTQNHPQHTQFQYKVLSNNKRAVSSAVAVVITVVLMLIGFGTYIAITSGFFGAQAPTPPPSCTTCTTTSTTQTQNSQSTSATQAYQLNTAVTAYDHFNPGTTYTSGTNDNVNWLASVNGSYQTIGTNAQTVTIQPTYHGQLFAQLTIPSGQNYYVDPYLTKVRNAPYVSSWAWTSPFNTGVNNFLFTLTNIPVTPVGSASNSQLAFYPYLIAYQSLSLASVSNVSSIGTSPVNEFTQWTVSFSGSSANVGAEITQITLTYNDSNTGVVSLTSINDPASYSTNGPISAGYIQSTDSRVSTQSSTTSFTDTINLASKQTDMSTGQFLMWQQNTQNTFYFTTNTAINFGASPTTISAVSLVITIYVVTPSGGLATLTGTIGYHK